MSWINGACIASYARLKKKHLRHHTDRLDVVTFDYRAALRRVPLWVQRGILALEWAYVPAVELLIRGMIVAAPMMGGAGCGPTAGGMGIVGASGVASRRSPGFP